MFTFSLSDRVILALRQWLCAATRTEGVQIRSLTLLIFLTNTVSHVSVSPLWVPKYNFANHLTFWFWLGPFVIYDTNIYHTKFSDGGGVRTTTPPNLVSHSLKLPVHTGSLYKGQIPGALSKIRVQDTPSIWMASPLSESTFGIYRHFLIFCVYF